MGGLIPQDHPKTQLGFEGAGKTLTLGLQSDLRFEGGTGVGLEGPVIPSEEVLGALGRVFFAS